MFEWDQEKAARNLSKHSVPFAEAATVFGDLGALTFLDPDHSMTELRFITIGFSTRGRLLFVAHADRNERTRIISARPTTKLEAKQYAEIHRASR